jgi:hypothetical protein
MGSGQGSANKINSSGSYVANLHCCCVIVFPCLLQCHFDKDTWDFAFYDILVPHSACTNYDYYASS